MKLAEDLKTRQHGKWPQYFIPLTMMDDKHKSLYEDQVCEMPDEDTDAVEDVLGDITSLQGDTSEALKQAQLENVKARTKMLQEKLEARKHELFNAWSERFYEIFAKSFIKVKNDIIGLHLDKEQLTLLQEKIDAALKGMEDALIQINAEWMNEEEEEEK